MTSAERLRSHIRVLRDGLAAGIGDTALDQLVANVTHVLVQSFDQGDVITVADTGMKLKTRLQAFNAINHGYEIDVRSAAESETVGAQQPSSPGS